MDDAEAFSFGLDAAVSRCYRGRPEEESKAREAIARVVGGCCDFQRHPDASFFALKILVRALRI